MVKSLLAAIVALCLFALTPDVAFTEQHLSWNGKEIKGWICDGKVLKPKVGATAANTWDVGSAPILVIAGALVLHLY